MSALDSATNEILLEKGFEQTASVPERTTSLVIAGFSLDTIAQVTGVTVETVERWKRSSDDLRIQPFEELDNLRAAMLKLIRAGLEPDTAAIWMQTPLTESTAKAPLDAIAKKPAVVFSAIDLVFGKGPSESAETEETQSEEAEAGPKNPISFGEVFADRRNVRRIKLKEFGRVGIKSSLLTAIEKRGLLPSAEQRDALLDLMAKVALEQDADSVAERQLLLEAWWETKLDRLHQASAT